MYAFSFVVSILFCNPTVEMFSGWGIIASVTARRKTFAGQECEYCSSKKNRGASKKPASGSFCATILERLLLLDLTLNKSFFFPLDCKMNNKNKFISILFILCFVFCYVDFILFDEMPLT